MAESRVEQIIAKIQEHAAEIDGPGSLTLTLDCPPDGEPTIKIEKVYRPKRRPAA